MYKGNFFLRFSEKPQCRRHYFWYALSKTDSFQAHTHQFDIVILPFLTNGINTSFFHLDERQQSMAQFLPLKHFGCSLQPSKNGCEEGNNGTCSCEWCCGGNGARARPCGRCRCGGACGCNCGYCSCDVCGSDNYELCDKAGRPNQSNKRPT